MQKILHVSPSYARREGGPSEVLRGLIPALNKLGFEQTVVTTDKGSDATDEDFVNGNDVIVFRAHAPLRWTFAPAMVVGMIRHVRECDVVHIHSIHTFPSSLAMLMSRLMKKPYILEPHGALNAYHLRQRRLFKSLYTRIVDKKNLRNLSGIIYSTLREKTDASLAIPKVDLLPMVLGVDKRVQDLVRDPALHQEVLYLGRITQKKRLDIVLRAMALPPLVFANCRLIVAGPVDVKLNFDPVELSEILQIRDRVSFLGQVNADTRRNLLASASIFVLMSDDESFGMAAAEAMAAGCPVVSSVNVGIAPEAERFGALVISEQNPDALSNAVSQLLESKDDRDILSLKAREFALEFFTWEKAAEQAQSAYRHALTSKVK